MKALFIINDPPYGTERVYNSLGLAHALLKNAPPHEVTVFLLADAVIAANADQKTPEGYYNIERMINAFWPVVARCFCAAPAWTRAVLAKQTS